MSDIPKYMILVNWIRDLLKSGELTYGSKLYSENELKAMFGYSRQTIRQAIQLLVQEGLLETRRGSGTYVVGPSSPEKKQTMVIGVITTYINAYIFPKIIGAIEHRLMEKGYSMQLAFTQNKTEMESRAISSMMAQEVDGFIIEPAKTALPSVNRELYLSIQNQKIPTVFFNSFFPDNELLFPRLRLDDYSASSMATSHLIDMGHRKIGGIFKLDDYQGHLRFNGFVSALSKSNILFLDQNALWYSTETLESVLNSSTILNWLEKFTGIVCYNDEVAIKLIQLANKNGIKIPDQISVIGIDNSDMGALVTPSLTSVEHPMEVLGNMVVDTLVNQILGEKVSFETTFPPKLVKRKSIKHLEPEKS